MLPVYLNGKFCAQRTTGVQRYAHGLLAAVDAWLAEGRAAQPWTLLLPQGAPVPALRSIEVRPLAWAGPGRLHGWEQFALPRAARDGLLINLSGSAPAFGARQICAMHDAALFDQPQAYSRSFGGWYRWLFRRLSQQRGTTLITNSAFSRARLSAALDVAPQCFSIVPGAAQHLDAVEPDASLLDTHGLRWRGFVLAVGSRNPTKNLARLIEAWRLLGRDDLRLVLVGGAHARVFGASASDATALRGVIDLGPVDDAALKALYRNALALVFPSTYEGFGLPPLEAMAAGCPVAASTAPALREVCGDAALFFDPLSPDAIAQALRRLADEPNLRVELVERGRRRAAQFTWDAAAQALLGVVTPLR